MKKNRMKIRMAVLLAAALMMTGGVSSVGYAHAQMQQETGQIIDLTGMSEEEKAAARREKALSLHYTTVEELFDAEFYQAHYPQVVKALGTDRNVLLEHFLNEGLKNGERCSELLDLVKYRETYEDLDKAFGDNWDLYVAHFFSIGVREGRWNGIDKKKPTENIHRDWKYDAQGNVLIPWEWEKNSGGHGGETEPKESEETEPGESEETEPKESEETESKEPEAPDEGYHQWESIEALKSYFGDDLMLLERDGEVLFIGGNFTDMRVQDEKSAMLALDSIKKLTGFPEEVTALYLTRTVKDESGATYYRFCGRAKDEAGNESNYLYGKSDIILGADEEGNVLCMSTSASAYFKENITEEEMRLFDFDLEKWEALKEEISQYGTLRSEEPMLRYFDMDNQHSFFWVFAAEKDGCVTEYPIWFQGDDSSQPYEVIEDAALCRTYRADTYGTEEAYANDYLIRIDDTKTREEMAFKDAYGNTVMLPVVWDEDRRQYYICDEERKLVCVDNAMKWNEDKTDLIPEKCEPYYFSDPDQIDGRYISAIQSVRHVMDIYQSLGYMNFNQSTVISINDQVILHNADASVLFGSNWINLYDCDYTTAYDVYAHEMTHNVLHDMTGGLAYLNTAGAVNESYADILGNLLEMMTYQKLMENPEVPLELKNVDREFWYLGETSEQYSEDHHTEDRNRRGEILRSMSNPNNYEQPKAFGDAGFIVDVSTGDAVNDNGGVHKNSGLLNYAAFLMCQRTDLSMKEVFEIWYDTLPLLTEDVSYYKLEQYILYVMKQKSIDAETIEIVEKCFEEAGILETTPEASTWYTLDAAEGSKVITLNVCTTDPLIEDLLKITVISINEDKQNQMYRDTEGIYGHVVPEDYLKEGSAGQLVLIYRSGAEQSIVVTDPLLYDPDTRLKMDLRDANASLLSILERDGNREGFLDAYEKLTKQKADEDPSYEPQKFDADYIPVRFLLVDEDGNILKNYKLSLLRDTDDVNVPFGIDTGKSANQAEDDERQMAYLIKNERYKFVVMDESGNRLEESTAPIQIGEEESQEFKIKVNILQSASAADVNDESISEDTETFGLMPDPESPEDKTQTETENTSEDAETSEVESMADENMADENVTDDNVADGEEEDAVSDASRAF